MSWSGRRMSMEVMHGEVVNGQIGGDFEEIVLI